MHDGGSCSISHAHARTRTHMHSTRVRGPAAAGAAAGGAAHWCTALAWQGHCDPRHQQQRYHQLLRLRLRQRPRVLAQQQLRLRQLQGWWACAAAPAATCVAAAAAPPPVMLRAARCRRRAGRPRLCYRQLRRCHAPAAPADEGCCCCRLVLAAPLGCLATWLLLLLLLTSLSLLASRCRHPSCAATRCQYCWGAASCARKWCSRGSAPAQDRPGQG